MGTGTGTGTGALAPGFRQEIRYESTEGALLLEEKRTVAVYPELAGYRLAMDFRFRAPQDKPVMLERTPRTEQHPWGGYAGLSCRLARNFMNPVITTDKGTRTAEEAHGLPARWCDYSGRLDGARDRWAGIALFDHPDNPRHPSPMLTYDYKDLQFLQAAFLCEAGYRIEPGEELHLRYGVYVHDGPFPAEEAERLAAAAAAI